MTKRLLALILGLVATTPVLAQGARCEQSDLDGLAAAYLAAQTAGDPIKLPLADFTTYSEQGEIATMFSGAVGQPRKIDLQRSFTDLASCQVFVTLVSAGGEQPVVIGTRLQFSGRDNPIAPSRVNDIDSIVADKGDYQFDAAATVRALGAQKWDTIPPRERDTRAVLVAVANAWIDARGGKAGAVPLATACERLEGGRVGACDAGLPGALPAGERRMVVDEAHGAVAVLMQLGPKKLPDAHLFRVEKGKLRYIDGITACPDGACGLPAG